MFNFQKHLWINLYMRCKETPPTNMLECLLLLKGNVIMVYK